MGWISEQPRHRGVVTFWNAERHFGFIEPEGSDGTKEGDVWFGGNSLNGERVGRGDVVSFVLYSEKRGINRAACRVRLLTSAHENVGG